MPRPRTNDPQGVTDQPRNIVTDPTRVDAITTEFGKKLAFVESSYRSTIRALGNDLDFNRSLAKLNRSLNRKRPAKRRGERAHPEIEVVILKYAMDHAAIRTGSTGAVLTKEDANFGARRAADLLRPRRRSSYRILRHHLRGLMALIQDTTGQPVLFTHHKDNLYAPQAVNMSGRALLLWAEKLDPTASVTTIATIVKQARREYAGKAMLFSDFFPTYRHEMNAPQPMDKLGPNYQVVTVLPFCPIYFP
ncbi:hypothetical protein [Croceicoccus sp. BE223]|uniref:hypothetical protein n=1 Tax=Croceicoccus sp. BE223 TaxID=2817716 RepID=UPI00285465B6|nr:hypothetical protein [Croceicoccus sp. BE223]MDR7102893.1 hypothetical protein [Croceicoccus sp. BE223]